MSWQSILKMSKGKDWEVYFLKDSIKGEGRKQVMDLSKNQEPVEWDNSNFNHHYELVASIQFHNSTMGHEHLFRLTNSVDEEWAKEFEGEQDDWSMQIEKSGSLRSSSMGDVFFDKDSNKYWMIAEVGFKEVDVGGQ